LGLDSSEFTNVESFRGTCTSTTSYTFCFTMLCLGCVPPPPSFLPFSFCFGASYLFPFCRGGLLTTLSETLDEAVPPPPRGLGFELAKLDACCDLIPYGRPVIRDAVLMSVFYKFY
jgi:hypothetical protein